MMDKIVLGVAAFQLFAAVSWPFIKPSMRTSRDIAINAVGAAIMGMLLIITVIAD